MRVRDCLRAGWIGKNHGKIFKEISTSFSKFVKIATADFCHTFNSIKFYSIILFNFYIIYSFIFVLPIDILPIQEILREKILENFRQQLWKHGDQQ